MAGCPERRLPHGHRRPMAPPRPSRALYPGGAAGPRAGARTGLAGVLGAGGGGGGAVPVVLPHGGAGSPTAPRCRGSRWHMGGCGAGGGGLQALLGAVGWTVLEPPNPPAVGQPRVPLCPTAGLSSGATDPWHGDEVGLVHTGSGNRVGLVRAGSGKRVGPVRAGPESATAPPAPYRAGGDWSPAHTMGVPAAALCLAWALALGCAHPLTHSKAESEGGGHPHGAEPLNNDTDLAQLCADEGGFDAATLSENGTMLFFRGEEVWERPWGASRPHSRPLTEVWPELGAGPVDAALRLHRREHPEEHQSLYLFQGEQVWAYAGGQLRPGFPRRVGDEFPGVPGGLDAAVECHPEECGGETILFFKGDTVFAFDVSLRVAKPRAWPGLGPCAAALRWLGRFFCLRGTRFHRFEPRTGLLPPGYPRDVRDYFIPCPGRGHGQGNESWGAAGDPCSGAPVQALLSDDDGHVYAFRGSLFFRLDSHRDGHHAWPVGQSWPGLEGGVDAAFAWDGRTYLIQGSQVSIFLPERGPLPVGGYPRALQDELGVPTADAAFTCPGSAELYLISGDRVRRVDLRESPRRAGEPVPLPHERVDAAMCTRDGVFLFRGPSYHQYPSAAELLGARQPAPPQSVAARFFQCPQ
ncbi:LOW QUALITY PROTEIN: hemopexin [Leptosomus discolor]